VIRRYKTNLRCEGCVGSIAPIFNAASGVTSWSADVTGTDKVLTVEGDVPPARVGDLLGKAGYAILGEVSAEPPKVAAAPELKTSYFPLVLIVAYILVVVGAVEVSAGVFEWHRAMTNFMAGFFLVFSFFKLLDVRSFAVSYSGYDIVARRWPGYGFLYPFLELALGAAYLANLWPMISNLATLAVMGVSTVGVVQALLARRKIQCACLGTVFNLPMSSVTLIEDLLMIAMAGAMLIAT